VTDPTSDGPPRTPWHLVCPTAALAALVAIVTVQWHLERFGGVGPGRYRLLTLILVWQALAIVAATLLRWIRPRRVAAGLVIASLIALPAASLTRGSQISDDLYRYAWDGRLQAAGVDPYRYAPDAPQLAKFRDDWLWPDTATCAELHKAPITNDPRHACTRINRPAVRTIYPPAAEGYFLVAHWLPGPSRDHKLQLDAAILSAALTGLLAFGLRRTGRDPLSVAYYSFSPLAGLDIAADAHVDVLAALLGVGAILLATLKPRAVVRTAVALGLAVAVKLYPALLLPALLRRGGGRRGALRLVAAAAGVVVVGYLPHVFAVGGHVLGYLPGYLHEENYDSGSRFLLVGLLGLGTGVTEALAVLLVATALLVVAVRSSRGQDSPASGALAVLGVVFLVVTPSQPWYALLLVCVSLLTGRLEWIAVAVAPYPLYVVALIHQNSQLAGRISFGFAGTFALAVTLIKALHASQTRNNPPPTDIQFWTASECPIAPSYRRRDGEPLAQTPSKGAFNA
jgi:Glycosyltransferase family 87